MNIPLRNLWFLFSFILCVCIVNGQILQLPPRQANAPSGSDFANSLIGLGLTEREDSIFSQVTKGNVPDFMRNLVPVNISEIVNIDTFNITYYVIPDYLAIGCDTDYFLCPMTAVLAQRIANYTHTTLPTRKMVNEIYNNAALKLAPITQSPIPQMTEVPYFIQHNDTIWSVRGQLTGSFPLGVLVGGDKKDVVISNEIYESGSEWVVIYGWHMLNGTPIQPLYNGHILYYADYSHGIRLVQNQAYMNNDTVLITDILQDATLWSVFSDEGIISVPYYPLPQPVVAQVKSFAVIPENANSVRIVLNSQTGVSYIAEYSNDGINFNDSVLLNISNPVISGLSCPVCYVRVVKDSAGYYSVPSEVLAATPTDVNPEFLIVNGFDRNTTTNTYDYIIQHGGAISANNYHFASCTNEALCDSLVLAENFNALDYILGEESSADSTFNDIEKELIKFYLKNGGYLFVSGSEIGWDLEHLGNADDSLFYHDYLKADYIEDAPGGLSSTYYAVTPVSGDIFENMQEFWFDDGTHGTYNVDWPDVITPVSGADGVLKYSGIAGEYSGIKFEGLFPSGLSNGKLVYLAFPFETIYPDSIRAKVMRDIVEFFFGITNKDLTCQSGIKLYPNPCKDIIFIQSDNEIHNIDLYSSAGICVYTEKIQKNSFKHHIDMSCFSSGIYFLRIDYNVFRLIKR
ncbi:MAG: hypothetical protein Kow0068_10250 [Marinilabiliales bacterium]